MLCSKESKCVTHQRTNSLITSTETLQKERKGDQRLVSLSLSAAGGEDGEHGVTGDQPFYDGLLAFAKRRETETGVEQVMDRWLVHSAT